MFQLSDKGDDAEDCLLFLHNSITNQSQQCRSASSGRLFFSILSILNLSVINCIRRRCCGKIILENLRGWENIFLFAPKKILLFIFSGRVSYASVECHVDGKYTQTVPSDN